MGAVGWGGWGAGGGVGMHDWWIANGVGRDEGARYDEADAVAPARSAEAAPSHTRAPLQGGSTALAAFGACAVCSRALAHPSRTAVRPQPVRLGHVGQRDQLRHVHARRVRQQVVGGVQVHNDGGPAGADGVGGGVISAVRVQGSTCPTSAATTPCSSTHRPAALRNSFRARQYVVLPLPGGPQMSWPHDCCCGGGGMPPPETPPRAKRTAAGRRRRASARDSTALAAAAWHTQGWVTPPWRAFEFFSHGRRESG